MLAIHIAAPNSPNGNPQRGWLIADHEGDFIDFVDEGYQGNDALRVAGLGDCPVTVRIDVTRSTYHDAKRKVNKHR